MVPLDSSRSSHHGSITRLEMVGGISGLEGKSVMKGSLIEEEVDNEEETWFWTDSCCLLRQVNDPTASQPAFLANRLSKIWKDSEAISVEIRGRRTQCSRLDKSRDSGPRGREMEDLPLRSGFFGPSRRGMASDES